MDITDVSYFSHTYRALLAVRNSKSPPKCCSSYFLCCTAQVTSSAVHSNTSPWAYLETLPWLKPTFTIRTSGPCLWTFKAVNCFAPSHDNCHYVPLDHYYYYVSRILGPWSLNKIAALNSGSFVVVQGVP